MGTKQSDSTITAGLPGSPRRRRPLVSPDAVREWAKATGLDVGDGPLDEAIVERYLNRLDDPPSPPREREAPKMLGPEPCPSCGGPGYLDYVDLARATQTQRCRPCGKSWTSAIPGALVAHR